MSLDLLLFQFCIVLWFISKFILPLSRKILGWVA
jgi:F0F1-type ATP synthase membrane subunit b/b'